MKVKWGIRFTEKMKKSRKVTKDYSPNETLLC